MTLSGPATSARTRIAAVAWSLALVVTGYLLTAALTIEVLSIARAPALVEGTIGPGLVQAAAGITIFGCLTWAVGRKILRLSARELGWTSWRVGIAGFGKGMAIASIVAVGGLVAGLPARSRWQFDGGGFAEYVGRVVLLAVVLLPPAFFEELAFRGALIGGLARGVGRWGAVAISSILFALAHRANPSVTILALANITLAGAFLGLTFLARGGLWTATGAHLGWNLTLAGLAAPVSGLPFAIPWIDFHPGAPAWLTGGLFGPEGGLLATAALIVGTVSVARWREFREDR